jgi:parallel beta-helix repeat protein
MKTRLLSIAIILAFCLSLVAVVAPPVASPARAATIWYVNPGASIQAAVDAASRGDTIIVRDGTYIENVDVTKDHLTIRSENGAESTIVQAANPNDHVFEVTADYVNIYGFTIKGATGQKTYTESFEGSSRLTRGFFGLEDGFGRWINESSLIAQKVINQTSVTTSIVTSPCPVHSGQHSVCQYQRHPGELVVIFLPCSPGQAEYSIETWIYVEERTDAYASSLIGFLFESTDSTPGATGLVGWGPWGDDGSYSSDIGGGGYSYYKPVGIPDKSWHYVKITYYTEDATFSIWVDNEMLHEHIGSGAAPGQPPEVFWVSCSKCDEGNVMKQYLDDVTVSEPSAGLWLNNVEHCSIFDNRILGNNNGIAPWNTSNNVIYCNDFLNNTVNVHSRNSTNSWQSPEEITYSYNGNIHTNHLGNYWSDYSGSDAVGDGNGIGDTAYSIESYSDNSDDCPLMQGFENYSVLDWSPRQPSNIFPRDGATGLSLTPTLESSAFSDHDPGDTHAASQWQITTTAGNYTSPAFDSGADTGNLTSMTVPAGTLSYSTYYWHVRYQDSHNQWSTWSGETSFTVLVEPQEYDGNNDGIPDCQQDNVDSLPTYDGQHYVTVVFSDGTTVSDVWMTPNPSPADTPSEADFRCGFLGFTIQGVGIGGTEVTIYMPEGVSLTQEQRLGRWWQLQKVWVLG